jgi:hypothetical protein
MVANVLKIQNLHFQTHNYVFQIKQDEITDPLCSSVCPTQVHFEDITSAAFKIKSGVLVTPCMVSVCGRCHTSG